LTSVARVVAEARKLVRACGSAGIPAPTESLEAALRVLDADLGRAPTECASADREGRLVAGQLAAGREYVLVRDGEDVMTFKFLREFDPRPGGVPEGFFAEEAGRPREERRLYYADVGMAPYASKQWNRSCRVVKAELDDEDIRRILAIVAEGEEDLPAGPVA